MDIPVLSFNNPWILTTSKEDLDSDNVISAGF